MSASGAELIYYIPAGDAWQMFRWHFSLRCNGIGDVDGGLMGGARGWGHGLSVVLFQPRIAPNAGNVARTCVATNTPMHMVGPLGFSLDDRRMRRAGLDYWAHLDLVVHPTPEAFLEWPGIGRLVLTTARGGVPYTDFPFRSGDFLVFGSETEGLPGWLYRHACGVITIPTSGMVRSLNLSNSVAIILFEALRRLFNGRFPGVGDEKGGPPL